MLVWEQCVCVCVCMCVLLYVFTLTCTTGYRALVSVRKRLAVSTVPREIFNDSLHYYAKLSVDSYTRKLRYTTENHKHIIQGDRMATIRVRSSDTYQRRKKLWSKGEREERDWSVVR
jgi:hypothetical protein